MSNQNVRDSSFILCYRIVLYFLGITVICVCPHLSSLILISSFTYTRSFKSVLYFSRVSDNYCFLPQMKVNMTHMTTVLIGRTTASGLWRWSWHPDDARWCL